MSPIEGTEQEPEWAHYAEDLLHFLQGSKVLLLINPRELTREVLPNPAMNENSASRNNIRRFFSPIFLLIWANRSQTHLLRPKTR